MGFFDMLIKVYMAAMGARLFLPTISPVADNPLQRGLYAATEPVLRSLRQIVPRGRQGFDWSPLVAILLLVIVRGFLMSAAAGLPAFAGVVQSILDTLTFIVSVLAVLFLGVFFISIDSPFGYSQIGQTMMMITNPLLHPLRRMFGRGRNGADPAALVGIVLLAVVYGLLLYQLGTILGETTTTEQGPVAFIWTSVGLLVGTILDALFWIILIRAILSWFHPDPGSPLFQIIIIYSDPILAPIQRIMPGTYGIDFSPLIAIVIIGFIRSSLLPLLSQF
jgi:YggT family protein